MNRKGELQTSRISSNLRIWQSYSRVPQILKVLYVSYSWKYVARLGSKPLKFLYSEFLYNTQAVLGMSSSQLTNSIIFQRGRRKTTNQLRYVPRLKGSCWDTPRSTTHQFWVDPYASWVPWMAKTPSFLVKSCVVSWRRILQFFLPKPTLF